MGKQTKGADFTKVFPPAKEEDLPKEMRDNLRRAKALNENEPPKEGEQFETNLSKEDLDLINSSTRESNISSGSGGSRARKSEILEPQLSLNGTKFFQERAADSLAYWAQFDHYDIRMKDETYLKVYRVPAPKFALESLKNLNAEVTSGLDFNTLRVLNPMEIRKKEIQFDEAKYNTYLRHQGTNKPVTRSDLMDAEDSTVPDGIAESCLAISLSKWTEAKK